MNGKKIAALILVMIIASIAYGTQIMQKQASAMRTEANQAIDDCNASAEKRKNAATKLAYTQSACKEYRDFLKRWTPVIQHLQTGQEAEQALMGVVRNNGLVVLSQKFEVKDNRGSSFIPKTLQGTLVIQDEYSKVLNWLGELEKKIPLVRVNSCRIKQGENGRQINMEVHFEIPLVNLDAEVEQPKK
jgi:hypothetical protein